MAIPTYVASGALAAIATSTTLDTVYPSGVQSGDIALLLVRVTGGSTVSSYPSGFTQIVFEGPDTGFVGMAALAWKRCDGTESGATVTTTVSSASSIRGVLHVFRGCVRTGSPIDAILTSGYTAGTTTQTYVRWSALVSTVANTLGVHIGYRGRNTTLTPTVTADAAWTQRFDAYTQVSSATFTAEFTLETKDLAAAGTSATTDSTSTDSMGYYAMSLALVPAADTGSSLFFGSMF